MKNKILWKAMRKNLYSHYKKKKWRIGKWYKVKGELFMCLNGYHASKKIIDSMEYVPMEVLAKVEVRGKHLEQDYKQCWEEMRIVRAWKWEKKDSVALAIYAASPVLGNFEREYPNDQRPREAIQAARGWLRNPTKENESAARSAATSARSAAWSAAESARFVVWSATRSARSAATSAAESARFAVWSAESAAESEKTLDKIEAWIRRRINKLEEVK